ncbi:MAG: hypothetical protein O7D86_10390 [Proteobacteria bacterium]|nr:hypothetical protein [Pseudomonadota bacterium]
MIREEGTVHEVIANIQKKIKGRNVTEQIVLTGYLCPTSVYIKDLLPEKEYILALEKVDEDRNSYLKRKLKTTNNAYYLTPCS